MKKVPHITLEDIARRLDVSRVTVSKALRGHPDISLEMTKRVRKVADDLGYSPNIIARSLSSRRSNMIGLVVPKIAHFFFGSVIESVYNTAFEHNIEMILTVSQENAERERKHLQTLVSMRVDGIIISISQETRDLDIFRWIRQMRIPLLFLDRRPDPPPPGFSSVLVDDRGGTLRAIDHAVAVGYRKLACIGGNPKINIGKERFAGFEQALEKHGIPLRKNWVIQGGFGRDDGYNGFMQLHRSGDMPEFIFAVTYPVALGVYEAAKVLGVRIPEDIDIMCFGDSDVSRFITPSLSCVNQPTLELGAKAVELMLSIIANPDSAADQHVIVPTDLILRETCVRERPAPRLEVG
ncbi:MAG TPA: LacI family DNA-binding transcriptional regulator [Bacteroidota bacterium]